MKHVRVELKGGKVFFSNSNQSVMVALKEEICCAQSGEVVLVKGSNGSGKSLLLKAWSGVFDKFYDDVDASDISKQVFCGRDSCLLFPRVVPSGVAGQVTAGYLAQAPRANVFCRSVEEEIWFPLEHSTLSKSVRTHRANSLKVALQDFGIDVRSSPHRLSKGQQQLVGFVALLAASPDILFLDEPTAPLDDEKCEWLLSMLGENSASRKSRLTVLATQDPRVLNHFQESKRVRSVNIVPSKGGGGKAGTIRFDCSGGVPEGIFGWSGLQLVREPSFSLDVKDLKLRNGSCHLLLGNNGSGKSSIMDSIAGYLKAKNGHGYWNNTRWPVGRKRAREFVSYGFQNAEEQLCFFSVKKELEHLRKYEDWRLVDRNDVLTTLGDLGRVPWHLSFGQRKLISYISLIFTSPVLALDEPFSSLDEDNRKVLIELLVAYLASGGILLVSASRMVSNFGRLEITSRSELTPIAG